MRETSINKGTNNETLHTHMIMTQHNKQVACTVSNIHTTMHYVSISYNILLRSSIILSPLTLKIIFC